MGERFRLFLSAMAFGGGLCLSVAFALAFAPSAETRWGPVVTDVLAYDWRQEGPGSWSAEIAMVKHRSCPPTEVWGNNRSGANGTEGKAALVLNPAKPPPYEVPISYVEDDTPGSSHPTYADHQSFGRWRFGSGGRPVREGSRLTFEARHDCHMIYETASPLGPITVGQDTRR